MFGDKSKSSRHGANAVETLIGPRVVIRGDVSFSGGLYVEGKIIGKVVADEGTTAVLTIAALGSVEGEVHAPVVVIAGQLHGDVHACALNSPPTPAYKATSITKSWKWPPDR